MELGKLWMLGGVAFAAISGLVPIPHAAAVTAAIGLVAGWFVRDGDAVLFLAATLALALAHGALTPLPAVGTYLTDILGAVSALLNAAACTVIILVVLRWLRPASGSHAQTP